MIRAIIFDYGGVLMRTMDPEPRRELERSLDLEPGEAERVIFESERWDDAQMGQISNDGFWDDVGRRLELEAEEQSKFREMFWAGDRLDHKLLDLIRRLREAGYRIGLLSNAPADLRTYLSELGIADLFDQIVISAEVGMMKPDPMIYEHILELLDVEADEAIFTDDTRENVEAARAVGIHAVHFLDPVASLAQLETLIGGRRSG
jgi:epoxide hydrolase-like predicted phosphatase